MTPYLLGIISLEGAGSQAKSFLVPFVTPLCPDSAVWQLVVLYLQGKSHSIVLANLQEEPTKYTLL